MMKKAVKMMMALFMLVTSVAAFSQSKTVTGTVTSDLDGKPIVEATVRVKGSLVAVRTDSRGAYTANVPEGSIQVLIFDQADFDEKEVAIDGRSVVNVELFSNIRLNQYGVPVDRKPLDAESREGILVFESKDRDYKVWFDTRVQVDGSFLWGAKYNTIPSFGTEVRRARFAMKAELPGNWEAELDMDFADSRADLKDLYLKYAFDDTKWIRAGNFKEVFSMETNTTSRYLTFTERPIGTRILTPSRHLGIQASYGLGPLLAFGGVHFQDVGGWEEVENRKTNYANGFSEGYSLTGKLIAMPFRKDVNKGLHLAVAGSYRTPKTHVRAGMQNAVRFDSRSYPNINRLKYLDTDRFVADNVKLGNLEFAGYYKSLRFQGEYTTASVTRPTSEVEKFKAFYAMGSFMLFGGKYRYNVKEGEFTQPSTGKSWGDVELALRYEYVDLNSREGFMWGSGEAYTAALNFYAKSNVKLAFNYRFVNHDRYANGRGALFVGTDINGNLTKDPKQVAEPMGQGGDSYNGFTFRVEVAF
jgi:phosphate-selective porin OprO/OprP